MLIGKVNIKCLKISPSNVLINENISRILGTTMKSQSPTICSCLFWPRLLQQLEKQLKTKTKLEKRED